MRWQQTVFVLSAWLLCVVYTTPLQGLQSSSCIEANSLPFTINRQPGQNWWFQYYDGYEYRMYVWATSVSYQYSVMNENEFSVGGSEKWAFNHLATLCCQTEDVNSEACKMARAGSGLAYARGALGHTPGNEVNSLPFGGNTDPCCYINDCDGDGIPDTQDPDDDNDGIPDNDDSCICDASNACLCDELGGDTDRDGVCDDLDCAPNDASRFVDADGDGHCEQDDCDDNDPAAFQDCQGSCGQFGGDADGDGCCADYDWDDNDPNVDNCGPLVCWRSDCDELGQGGYCHRCEAFGGDADRDGYCAWFDADDNDGNRGAEYTNAAGQRVTLSELGQWKEFYDQDNDGYYANAPFFGDLHFIGCYCVDDDDNDPAIGTTSEDCERVSDCRERGGDEDRDSCCADVDVDDNDPDVCRVGKAECEEHGGDADGDGCCADMDDDDDDPDKCIGSCSFDRAELIDELFLTWDAIIPLGDLAIVEEPQFWQMDVPLPGVEGRSSFSIDFSGSVSGPGPVDNEEFLTQVNPVMEQWRGLIKAFFTVLIGIKLIWECALLIGEL